ncbi:hypothetical protein TPA0908_02050 [Micromonospora sp. AKA38]|nr:hypothetical protein TPA0908_02050 [Micromonospora sp. AKA38]
MAARHRGYGPTSTDRPPVHEVDPPSPDRTDPFKLAGPVPAEPSQEPMCFPAPVTYCT